MASPGLDFDEHQGGAVDRDQIELAQGRANVTVRDSIPERAEVVFGERLAANPERIGWRRQWPRARREFGSR